MSTQPRRKLNVGQTIAELRKSGLDVHIEHERAVTFDVRVALEDRASGVDRLAQPLTFPLRQIRDRADALSPSGRAGALSPYGGKTIAIIRTERGENGVEIARGEAVCSPLDVYVRHTGAIKALGRALGELERKRLVGDYLLKEPLIAAETELP